MVCRRRHGIERFFDQREAARKLNDYPRNGPRKLTQLLIDAIKEEEVQGQALLDIDGGIGAIQPEQAALSAWKPRRRTLGRRKWRPRGGPRRADEPPPRRLRRGRWEHPAGGHSHPRPGHLLLSRRGAPGGAVLPARDPARRFMNLNLPKKSLVAGALDVLRKVNIRAAPSSWTGARWRRPRRKR